MNSVNNRGIKSMVTNLQNTGINSGNILKG